MKVSRLAAGRSAARGFTLLELLVTMAVFAILASVALPSMLTSLQARQAGNMALRLTQDISWVRAQALSGASPATITINSDCTWLASTGSTDDAQHSVSTAMLAQQDPGMTCRGIPASGIVVSFDGLGMALVNSGTSNPANTVLFQSGTGQSSVEIFGSGATVEDPQDAS